MLDPEVRAKLDEVEIRFEGLTSDLGNPEIIGDQRRYQAIARERSSLESLMRRWRAYKTIAKDIAEHEALLDEKDPELRELARAELGPLRALAGTNEDQVKIQLFWLCTCDARKLILEIQACSGGD